MKNCERAQVVGIIEIFMKPLHNLVVIMKYQTIMLNDSLFNSFFQFVSILHSRFYQRLTLNTKKSDEVNELFIDELITKKELNFLTKHLASPRTPIFYDLAKIKKVFTIMPPIRSILSSFNSCAFHVSKCFNYFLCYQARLCKSYVKNTKYLLSKSSKIKKLPKYCFLVTVNVILSILGSIMTKELKNVSKN